MSENLKRHRPDIKVLGEGRAIAFMPEDPMGVWVHIQEVRDLLDVKDKEIAELKEFAEDACLERDDNQNAIDELNEDIRRLKRALWIARAKSAEARKDYWHARSCHEGDERLWSIDGSSVKYIGCIKRTNFDWLKTWSEVECKCLKKAEQYK